MKINPYLNFPGTTEEAFNFYRTVFGGEFAMIQRFSDTPEKDKVPADVQNKIMHISLPVGDGNILMGTDALDELGHPLQKGNHFYLSLSADSREEADSLYTALSEGGNPHMPMADVFWGSYFGMLTDRYGTQWMVSYDENEY